MDFRELANKFRSESLSIQEDTTEYLDKVNEMLLDEDYEFSSNFLESIKGQILKKGYLSEKQKNAVDNIYTSVDRSDSVREVYDNPDYY